MAIPGLTLLRRSLAVACLVLGALASAQAQTPDDTDLDETFNQPSFHDEPRHLPPWLGAIWGNRADNAVSYLPVGIHSDSLKLNHFNLRGMTYGSMFGGAFRNSFGDRTWALGVQRTVVDAGRVHVTWWFGAMAGYDGRLVGSRGVPLSRSILFRHNINPCLGFPTQVDLTPHLQLEIFANPIASAVGLRVPFGPRQSRSHRSHGQAADTGS